MADQLFSDGKVISVDGSELECVAVSYQENPETQERHSFVYQFRLKTEVDAEREAAAKAEEDLKTLQEPPTEPANQPELIEEETQHVR
jgi:hypothetical protein